MKYFSHKISLIPNDPELYQLLIALMSESGYEAFHEEEEYFIAYIPVNEYKAETLEEIISNPLFSHLEIQMESSELPDINWNAEWEKNYKPIVIKPYCSIIAPHHKPQSTLYNILIEPKMSFGTGHHETTRLMIQQIYNAPVQGKRILDMGCGTGVLGIFCIMLEADFVTAIDIDPWAYENAVENFRVNQVPSTACEIITGGASEIPEKPYDIVLANINRNILLEDMSKYISCLNHNGLLIISGLLKSDREVIMKHADALGLSFVSELCENKWISLKFRK